MKPRCEAALSDLGEVHFCLNAIPGLVHRVYKLLVFESAAA